MKSYLLLDNGIRQNKSFRQNIECNKVSFVMTQQLYMRCHEVQPESHLWTRVRNLVSIWVLHLRFTAANSFRTAHLLFRQLHRMAKKQSDWLLESGSESWHYKSGIFQCCRIRKWKFISQRRQQLQCWAPRMSTDGCEWNQIISFQSFESIEH